MGITLYCGKPGGGKTANAVRDMALNQQKIDFYTNIIPKKPKITPHIKTINSNMIFKRVVIPNESGRGKPKIKIEFNKEYWDTVPRPIGFVWDEAHEIFDSHQSMSVINRVMRNMVAMQRRICGEGRSTSELIFITQLHGNIDKTARDLCTLVKYHECHYTVTCKKCGEYWGENSEMPESIKAKVCHRCGHYLLKRSNFVINVKEFMNAKDFDFFKDFNARSWFREYYITDIEKYFQFYDTMQWDNLFNEVYDLTS